MDSPPAESLVAAMQDAAREPCASRAEQLASCQALLTTVQHFCGGCASRFAGVSDPRDPSDVHSPLPALACAGVLLFLCQRGSRRQIHHLLRGTAAVAAKFRALCGVASCPQGDSLNALCQALVPEPLPAAVSHASARLIRPKVLSA